MQYHYLCEQNTFREVFINMLQLKGQFKKLQPLLESDKIHFSFSLRIKYNNQSSILLMKTTEKLEEEKG